MGNFRFSVSIKNVKRNNEVNASNILCLTQNTIILACNQYFTIFFSSQVLKMQCVLYAYTTSQFRLVTISSAQ